MDIGCTKELSPVCVARPVPGVVEDPHGGLELHLADAPVPRLFGLVSAVLAVTALPSVERLGERLVVDRVQVIETQGHHFQLQEGENECRMVRRYLISVSV